MKNSKEEIAALRSMIEQSVSRKISTPADFSFLTGVIMSRCKETLGITTLKRIWGYIDSDDAPRYSTLSILARCVGFNDWDDFVKYYDKNNTSSNFILSPSLSADEIPQDGGVRITWAPDRRCVFKHLGVGLFEVVSSENSKLSVGDTFHCSCFIKGRPLYVDRLIHENRSPKLFVLGNKGGLSSIEQIEL